MRCAVIFGIVVAIVSTTFAEVPRYKLTVGRKASYVVTTETKGTSVATGKTNIELAIVRENADGSRRIVFKRTSERDADGNKSQEVELSYADVFPDGRSNTPFLMGMGANAAAYFPPLPKDETEMTNGWHVTKEELQEEWTYTPQKSDAGEFVFNGVDTGMMNKIYASTTNVTFHFDLAKGIIVSKKDESTQDYGFHNKKMSEMKLVSDESISPTDAAAMATEYDVLFNTDARYHEKMVLMDKDPEHIATIARDAKTMLDEARMQAKTAPVKGALEKLADHHEDWVKQATEDAKKTKAIINQPAFNFSSTDLAGKPIKLADFRGKVVVMDFWYRGCGWCMYAMPQVKKLYEDFKDKNVVFLGMNTDKKEEDAKFVVETLALKYPTIKAQELPKKYGVQGFPTLIIIDQQGVLREFHVGYTPTLYKDISEKLTKLLAKPAASAAGASPKP